ncbi:radical SAM protein [Streptomyces zingiberis]|uniref:Radical SAM protein n=1 Tax=Streptomyces zingiberis TaxID=2053010 RepID=A0ABX1BX86_9ACTN|nr:radical SAM protein [Streptomyces zingiberis]NJQ01718.1 radical SAM protein [Streptomyces zingiberis]
MFKSLETCGAEYGRLRSLEIGVTSRCNFRCAYCGAYDLLERQVLSPADVVRVIEALPDLERVKLSGGEVLLEFDLCEQIIGYCSSRGILTQVNSNGTLLDEEKFERLEAAGLGVLHVSLNHVETAAHAAFYRVSEKMFPRIVRAVERSVSSSSIDTVVETVLFDETEATLPEVHRFAAGLGVRRHEIQMEIPGVHQGYTGTLGQDRLCEAVARLVEARDPRCTLYVSCLSAHLPPGGAHWSRLAPLFRDPGVVRADCVEGKAQLHLHSNGDVLICELGCPEVIGNVFEEDLLTLYRTSARLRDFVRGKHEEGTHSCFRHCDRPGERRGASRGPAFLPVPRVRP